MTDIRSDLNREIEKEEKNRPNWMTRWLGEEIRDCERKNDYEAGRGGEYEN